LPFSKGINLNTMLLSQYSSNIENIQHSLKLHKDNLLLISFKTVYFYLNGIVKIKKLLPNKSILILCAAVSDFIPKDVS